jgi:GNAT superfamily N-acetyltransferase
MNASDHKRFILPGYRTNLLHAADQAELQTLLEKCADYSFMVTGSPPKPSAAALLLVDCPAGKTLADKFVFGFYAKKQGLLGVLDAMRDYPTQNDWWLGLLLLVPAQRSKGLGRRIYHSFEQWVSQQGAGRVFLGVVEANQRAYQFWRTMGFTVAEREPGRQFGDTEHVVLVMQRNLKG